MTNFSLFEWRIASIVNMTDTTLLSYIAYHEEALDGCAPLYIQMHSLLPEQKVYTTILSMCELSSNVALYLKALTPKFHDSSGPFNSFINRAAELSRGQEGR
jgi:hypothetical protein